MLYDVKTVINGNVIRIFVDETLDVSFTVNDKYAMAGLDAVTGRKVLRWLQQQLDVVCTSRSVVLGGLRVSVLTNNLISNQADSEVRALS